VENSIKLLPPNEAQDWYEHSGTQNLVNGLELLIGTMREDAFQSILIGKSISPGAMDLLYKADAIKEVLDLIQILKKGDTTKT